MRLYNFDEFILEKLGISENLTTQAKEFFNVINNNLDKFVFEFKYKTDDKEHDLVIFIDSMSKIPGFFTTHKKKPTIVLKERNSIGLLIHELKHADRYFRRGRMADTDNIGKLYRSSHIKKNLSFFPKKWSAIFWILYLATQEEFEARFHEDFNEFTNIVLQNNSKTRKEVMSLWSKFHIESETYVYYKLLGNKPSPLRFTDELDVRIKQLIWFYFRQNYDKKGFFDWLKLLVPKFILDSLDEPINKKYLPQIESFKSKLEKEISQKFSEYFKKYQRIPVLVMDELNITNLSSNIKNIHESMKEDYLYTNENVKVGDIFNVSDIYDYVQQLHYKRSEDFEDGDLSQRISHYDNYEVQEIPMDDITIDEYEIDEDDVQEYIELYEKNGTYPPIVIGHKHFGTHDIIDGTHRANALNELGFKSIICFVGKE
jgi:hypothetical protein